MAGYVEGVRIPNTPFCKGEKNLLRAEIQIHHGRLNMGFLLLPPNVLLRRSNYSDLYFLVNNHICHNWFNQLKAPSWQSWWPEPMCQLCPVDCKQKLHGMEKREKNIHRYHIDVGTNMCFSTTVISTETPKCGQWVSIPRQLNLVEQTELAKSPGIKAIFLVERQS